MSLQPLASSCRAAVELFGAPILLQDGTGCKSRHVRSSGGVQQHQQLRSSSQTVACAALFIAASARCSPRGRTNSNSTRTGALRFAPVLTKGKLKRRRRGSGSGEDDDYSSRWDDEAWQQLWNGDYGGGDNNGNNGWRRGWGSGGNGGDPFHRVLFEWLWVWQLLCVASMLQSWYFMLFPRQSIVDLDASPDAAELVRARVGMVY